ncbi:MAG: hypothetical protein Q4A34_03525 [Candidatus Saccharibacteria bacterium]|nr:hypothetical protein [Candidatus Saccharibacteria bacterium]
MAKTRARLKINQILTGQKTNARVVGCLLFREWDEKDKRFYYWEEWEITGLRDYDTWVEYDHDEGEVSLYTPIRFTQAIDPQTLQKGQKVQLTDAQGNTHDVTVEESGIGQIIAIQGKNTYQVFEGEMMAYATLRTIIGGKKRRITVEKYNNREYDAYYKVRLNDARQKQMFGRTIGPLFTKEDVVAWIVIIVFVLLMIGVSILFPDDSGSSGSRGVYGGSSGGFGK